MADQVYQPIVSDEDDQSETPSPQTELPIESWNEVKSRFEEDKSDLTTEEASQRQRQPDPESPEDAHARPIVKHTPKGDGPLTLNEAVDDALYSKWFQQGKELREAGLTDRQAAEMAAETIARAQRGDPVAPLPPEVKVLDHFGEDPDRPLTVTEATDALISWRERHAEAQQAELQELAGEAVAERQAEAAQAQPEPQRQQPQAPDPAQTERQQLAQEHQRLTYLKKMEGIEASWRHNYDQLCAEVVREFPSLQNGPPDPAHVEQLRQQDPARFQKLAQYDAALRDRQQKIAALAQQRGAREQQQAQINAQARAAARTQQDAAFEQLAAQHIPNWERVQGEVRAQARKTLENAGMSEQEIKHLWTSDDAIDAHSSVLQLVLAKAAQWDLAQERARQVRQTPVPPVMKPGTYRARNDGDSVSNLQSALSRASGREAIRIGAALTRARRANGG